MGMRKGENREMERVIQLAFLKPLKGIREEV